VLVCPGTVAGDVQRLLANDLGAALTDDCDDDEARRTRSGKADLGLVDYRRVLSTISDGLTLESTASTVVHDASTS